jgi:hypothetical protein
VAQDVLTLHISMGRLWKVSIPIVVWIGWLGFKIFNIRFYKIWNKLLGVYLDIIFKYSIVMDIEDKKWPGKQ